MGNAQTPAVNLAGTVQGAQQGPQGGGGVVAGLQRQEQVTTVATHTRRKSSPPVLEVENNAQAVRERLAGLPIDYWGISGTPRAINAHSVLPALLVHQLLHLH